MILRDQNTSQIHQLVFLSAKPIHLHEGFRGDFQSPLALWCIVSLPGGVFTAAGAGVKTNLLFSTKGKPTEKTWYYDLSDIKVGKKKPFTLDRFDDFFKLLPKRADSERSWTGTRKQIEDKGFDLKAVNPNAKDTTDKRTPTELLDLIEAKGKEVSASLANLRKSL